MNNDIKELMSGILKDMSALNYIKPGDVPNINLYMDQVTTFMYEHLHDTKRTTDDKVLTKTMINNYAKNNLLPSPVKKKYSKEHIYILTFIYYFKNILSISDIQKMLNPSNASIATLSGIHFFSSVGNSIFPNATAVCTSS